MPGTLATTLTLSLKAVQALTNDNFSTVQDPATFPYSGESWASGVAVNQADTVYRARRTLAASATDSLDLVAGLTDKFGNSLTFARVKLLAIYNRAPVANVGDILHCGGGSNAWEAWTTLTGSKFDVRPGGLELSTAPDATGWAVTPSTAHLFQIVNASGTDAVTYDIVIIGASA